ncbi:MAG TPA: L-lactate permease [Terriglobales bacterium]|nr:L-lactate permease [Terriglobales bacterium]
MPWLHNYSAVGHSLGLTAMVAALPIFFLFWVLAYKRMKGYLAASLTLLLMLLVAGTAPGTAMLFCAITTMAILRISPSGGLKVFRTTCNQLVFALVTLAAVVGIGYLANYSGMSYTLGLACASYTGKLFPIVSPVIGWLGVFLTGSVRSSAALFGKLQQVTATQTGINPVLTTSANLFGGVAGKLISPQSIASPARQPVWLAGKPISFAIRSSIRSPYWAWSS